VTLLPWLVVSALIAVTALYVAAEFAAVAVQRNQLDQMARAGQRGAAGLLSLLENDVQFDRYIAACQIGITLSSLVAGAYGQATMALELAPLLARSFALPPITAQSTAAVVVLLVLTTLQVVLGELVPKSLALQFPERTALATYLPTRISMTLYAGFIWLLNGSGLLLLKPFGITVGSHLHVHSPEELALLFAESRRGGSLSPESHRSLQRGLHLSTRKVRQLMVPRGDIVAIEASTPPEEILRRVLDSSYSRMPVYEQTLDRVIGAIDTKDLVGLYAARGQVPPLHKLLHPIPFVPADLSADQLVRFLQEQRSSKAIVVDEYGGVHGIVSIEDVLGQLFGDIGDELKTPDLGAEPMPDGRVRLPGSMPLDVAEPWLGTRWEGAAATVGGHIVNRVGRLPVQGERFVIDGLDTTILEMSPMAVLWVLVQPARSQAANTNAEREGS
jgi:putative hemolysin